MKFQSSAYLTIDDSPSERMDDIVDWLEEKGVPAIFYCRGDNLDKNMRSAVRAVEKGFVLANHTYSHERSSQKGLTWLIADIERCERLIEQAYQAANTAQPGRYFRFPHVDRGTAGWVVDYDAYEGEERNALLAAFAEGLNVSSMERPPQADWDKRDLLQNYLKGAGYVQPFPKVTHGWFNKGEVSLAADSLYTYSNCDWMLTARHRGKWPYKDIEDLKIRAKSDKWLTEQGSVNVILAHDQAEIVDITIELLDDLVQSGLQFLEV